MSRACPHPVKVTDPETGMFSIGCQGQTREELMKALLRRKEQLARAVPLVGMPVPAPKKRKKGRRPDTVKPGLYIGHAEAHDLVARRNRRDGNLKGIRRAA